MELLYPTLLGILQGFTEFFPVSSSGHLVIAQQIVPGFSQPGVLFDVFLHAGTLLAVIIYFYKDILKLTFRDYFFLGCATLPATVVGFLFSDSIELLFDNAKLVGLMLMITAFLNYLTDKNIKKRSIGFADVKNPMKTSFVIGLFQAIAITPGISRSGSTIFAGTKYGLKAQEAAKFSFLLSIPAIIGANILQFVKYGNVSEINVITYSAGFLAAVISGYIAIAWVIKLLDTNKFRYFSYYCLFVGVLVVVFLD
ncbi:undecaprenyl-diphosphate phosphatase [Candidatus Woesebacteria bacterium]|nr:MAG: undecaprenyl-diphosphate phosphatase [Candidatus Woesebacteria bacterium]